MPVIEIDVPGELGQRLAIVPAERRNNYAVAALTTGREVLDPEEVETDFENTVAALKEGFADITAGRTRPLSEYIAEQDSLLCRR